jgi:F-type H+-transporting ATPase subunit epsilon
MVIAPSVAGQIGLLAGHEPVMTMLGEGDVKISSSDDNSATNVTTINISGGFLSMYDNEVTVVADDAQVL